LALIGIGLAASLMLIAWRAPSSVAMGLALVAVGMAAYGVLTWMNVFSAQERAAWMSMVSRRRQSA
jgi:hypothetical protein